MSGSSGKDEASCPKLLDLISKDRAWRVEGNGSNRHDGSSDEKKLELRLGLPGDDGDNWCSSRTSPKINNPTDRDESLLNLRYYSPSSMSYNIVNNQCHYYNNKATAAANCCQDQKQKQVMPSSPWSTRPSGCHQQQQLRGPSSYVQYRTPGSSIMATPPTSASTAGTTDSSLSCGNRNVDLQNAAAEKKTPSSATANTAVPNTSQKRAAPAPVVGWPPVRSFRKNLASTSPAAKRAPEAQTAIPTKDDKETKPVENNGKGLFVKINMDGVPIGRKVDLHAYGSYENLSSAVDELFRDLLAAQRDSSVGDKAPEEAKAITGILDGNGEYTLVYEDNEGDRMLVGDVPWHMFVSTVKRLRALKSSDLSSLSRLGGKHGLQVQSVVKEITNRDCKSCC